MRRYKTLLPILIALSCAPLAAAQGWQKLFDGKTMKGWRTMAVHGGRGGVWTVERGALVANQDKDHTGGLLATERKFSDFEIELEFQADYPVDSGLFLRTRDDGMGYQITIDYRDKGSVGSLYAPAEGGFIQQNANWRAAYRERGWNRLRARVEGQPARVTAWLNGVQTVNFTDTRERYPREGYIGLQVHGGEGAWGEQSRARFRTSASGSSASRSQAAADGWKQTGVKVMPEGKAHAAREAPRTEQGEMSEAEIDNNLKGTFPASDPPSWTLGTDHTEAPRAERDEPESAGE